LFTLLSAGPLRNNWQITPETSVHNQNIALIPDCMSEQLSGGKRSGGGNTNTLAPTSSNSFPATMTGGLFQANLANTSVIAFEPLATGAINITTTQNNNAYTF
jgi:hypothetical protein